MAARSNITKAREMIEANKQALADMGIAGKEVDKIFEGMNKDLDVMNKLTKDQLKLFISTVELAREDLQLSKEKAKNKKKEKKEQTALDKQIRDHVNKVNEGYNDINNFLKGIPGVGRALSGVLDTFGPYVDQYNKFFGKTLKDASEDGVSKVASESGSIFKSKGKVMGFALMGGVLATGKKAFDTMTEMGLGMSQTIGLGFQVFFGEQLKAITEEFGSINESSLKLVGQMKMFSVFTGTSSADLAKTVGLMSATTGLTTKQVLDQVEVTRQMAAQAGIPIKGIMADVAGNAEFFAKFSKDGGQNILNAALQAKKLGINLGDVASISNSLLDFETSIEKQMEAQVLLGRNINTDRARQLAFSGDNVGLMKEVTRLAGSEAEFNNMNYLQREALAGAVGLTVERMSNLIRAEKQANNAAAQQFKTIAMIAGVLGAAVGFLVGVIPGFGLKSIMKGVAGAAVGAGVGAIGVGAAKSLGVPGLATGGIVNSPMLAMVGERGREAVTPLGAQGVEVDMRETNELLRALLGSSEKQVNRLGDIGTS